MNEKKNFKDLNSSPVPGIQVINLEWIQFILETFDNRGTHLYPV